MEQEDFDTVMLLTKYLGIFDNKDLLTPVY